MITTRTQSTVLCNDKSLKLRYDTVHIYDEEQPTDGRMMMGLKRGEKEKVWRTIGFNSEHE